MEKVTRVERFKAYREEIQMKYSNQNTTTKQKTSERVELVLQNSDNLLASSTYGNELSFDDVMGAYEIYDKKDEKFISPLEEKAKRRKTYLITSLVVIGALAIACLITGILYFGGFVK